LASSSFSSSVRASVPMRFSRSPASPITMALWPSRSTTMVAAMRTIRSVLGAGLFLELVDHHCGRIGQLISGEAKQLFAHRLASQELSRCGRSARPRHTTRPAPAGRARKWSHSRSTSLGFFGRHGHKFGKLGGAPACRAATVPARTPVTTCPACWPPAAPAVPLAQQRQHLGVAQVKLPASTTNSTRSTSPTAPTTVLFSERFSAVV
jgi:hypothetical protein